MTPVPAGGAATTAAPANGPAAHAAPARLVSLDAFRGFTMFWLMGGKAFVLALATLVGFEAIRPMLVHSDWAGARYYDLIWPSFMLMVGVSIPFSFAQRALTRAPADVRRSAWRRAAVLFLLGSLRATLADGVPRWIELSSALQPIALAYIVTTYLAGRSWKINVGVAVAILVGYALLLACVGPAAGLYQKNNNVVTAVDQAVLGRAHPDGWGTVLSAIPAVVTTLVGLLFGQVLRSPGAGRAKLKVFALTGAGCLVAGYGLSPVIPIVMKLWTTTYALVATGWAALLFAAFYGLVDLAGWRRWTWPLVIIGTNALAAYLLSTLLPIGKLAGILTKPLLPSLGPFGPVVASGAVLLLGWLILLALYRRRIFLRP